MELAPFSRFSSSAGGRKRITLAVVWIVCALYVAPFVRRGWVPHDEGTIAQSAANVLDGAVPHRDYGEPYTGGLTVLHAAAFRLFGVRLLSLRLVLLAFVLAFVPAFFALARRFVPLWAAALLTFLAVAWSTPNYFASLPSWYNLFFATFGTLAAVRHVETGRVRWLGVSGICAGLSVLVKIVGLYEVAAILLFLVYREQSLASARLAGRPRSATVLLSKIAGGMAFLACVLVLIRGRWEPMTLVNVFLPAAALVAYLVWSEWKEGRGAMAERLPAAARLFGAFLGGVSVPLVLLLVPFIRAGAEADLWRGLFVQPLRHIETSRLAFPEASSLWPAVPLMLVLALPSAFPGLRRRSAALALAALLGLVLALASFEPVYRIVWDSARSLGVAVVLAGCGWLSWRVGRPGPPDPVRQVLFLILCTTGLLGFVQFPFAAPIYYCYGAPLVALAVAAIVRSQPDSPRPLHICVLVFYLLFAVVWMNRGYVFNLGRRPAIYTAPTVLALPRSGLRVPAADARVYEELVALIRERAGARMIYAGPDCPEVYFLSSHRSPGRYFFDFLGGLDRDPAALLRLLDENRVGAVVLNRSPGFSQAPGVEVRRVLHERFPNSVEVGKFTFFWRS